MYWKCCVVYMGQKLITVKNDIVLKFVLTLTFNSSVWTGTDKPLRKYFIKPPLSPYIQECNSTYIIPVSQLDCDK